MITNITHLFSRDTCSVVWFTREDHFMDNNLPTDPEFRRKICALKGIPYTDPEPMAVAPAESEKTYTSAEIRALVEMAVNERMRSFEQRMKNMLGEQKDSSLLRTVEDLRWRIRDLEDRLTKPLAAPSPTNCSSYTCGPARRRTSRSSPKEHVATSICPCLPRTRRTPASESPTNLTTSEQMMRS